MRRWSSYQFYVYWFSSGALFSGFQLVLRSLHIFNASLRIFDVILHYFGRCSLIAFIYSIQGTNREGTISRGPDTGPLCKNPVRYAEKIALLLDPKVPCSRGEKQWLWVRNLKRELIICTYSVLGAFHYAKTSENFGQKSNGKVRFGSVRSEYLGPPLEVFQFDPSHRSDRNLPLHFDKPYLSSVDLTFEGNSGKE